MKEIITLQIGQCGNQIGWRFWDLLQQEHAANPTDSTSLLTFFQPTKDRNVPSDAPFSSRYRARAVLLDMEEGVVSQLLRSPIGPMFDTHMRLTDVSGAGNNWACGYAEYGPRYRDGAMDIVRRSLEACDSPQAFLMLHSLGGGTGSGFGSYVLEQLHDNFPELYRFNAPLLPSKNDDVITSPYNALLATARLIEHADAVLPVDNQCLMDLVAAVGKQKKTGDAATRSGPSLLDLDYKEKGKPLAPVSSASGVRHTSRAATSTASSSAAGAMALQSATVSAQASQLPSALASMLEQADAVLDAVSHGLGAQQPVTSSTALSSSSAIKSGVRRVGSATTSASGVAGVRPAVGVAGSTAAGAGSRSTATGSGVRRVAGTTAAAAAPGRSSIASAGNKVAAAVVGSAPRAALPAASSGSRAASGLSKGQATLPAPAKPATPGRVAQPDNRAAPRQPALLPQQQRPAAPAASHAAPFALHEEEKDGGDGEGGDAEEHDDSDALIKGPKSGNGAGGGRRKGTAYDAMNNLVGHMLSNLTASMRFPGQLNVDINEITSTLVPLPRLHFFSTSLTPLVGATGVMAGGSNGPGRPVDSRVCERVVSAGFGPSNMLVDSDIKRGVHLACGIFLRGPFAVSDVNAAVTRQQRELKMVSWNPDGFKIGLCSSSPLYSDVTALCISNNCSIRHTLATGYSRFLRLYQARAHVHHYLEYIPADEFQHAAEAVTGLINDYAFED